MTTGTGRADGEDLSGPELVALLRRAFAPRPEDSAVAILVDLPDVVLGDHEEWRERRRIAQSWARLLAEREAELGLPTRLYVYRNAHANNAQLPGEAFLLEGEMPADAAAAKAALEAKSFAGVFTENSILLAPTELSATAPLKLAAKKHGFRAATLPGFNRLMIPALRLDYGEVDRRVRKLKALVDGADQAEIEFRANGQLYHLVLDLRGQTGFASSGLLAEPGIAGNLPSGEAYIVPREGRHGQPSLSKGILPVELDGELVLYQIENNQAVAVLSQGEVSQAEAKHLAEDPAYGNLAELGLGVLDEFGIEPIGQTLLDEKLGLHIAFGRSDHFGGSVGPGDFISPDTVVHIDRVYVPAIQPQVQVPKVDLRFGDDVKPLMRGFQYVCGWD
jgi:leucyl aminopeptidase (aminopeptidase T)